MTQCAYVFLDEAGNFDFSPTGTRYFVMSSVSTRRPFPLHPPLDDYKHDCLEYGLNTEFFHCAEDNTHVRSRVFGLIAGHLESQRIDSLVVEKAKTGPALRADEAFYPKMLGYLLRYVVEREVINGIEELIVITDTIPIQKRRKAVEKAIKTVLVDMLPGGVRYRILHHESRSHFGLQVADYCNWAVFRKWERGDTGFYNMIKPALRSEFDIFRTGVTYYY